MAEEYRDYKNEEAFLDALIAFLQAVRPECQMLDFRRLWEVLCAKEMLEELLSQNAEQSQVRLQFYPETNAMAISAEIEDWIVHDTALCAALMQAADNFEIYPLTNGKMCIAFTFGRAFIAVA